MKKKKILILENDQIQVKLTKSFVENIGLNKTEVAKDVEQAFMMIKKNKPDLVLMSISQKNKHEAFEAAKKIRFDMDIPVVYLSYTTDKKSFEEALPTDPFGYLKKPFSENDLNEVLKMALLRIEKESSFKKSEEKYLKLIENVQEGVCILDENEVPVFINQSLSRILGYKYEEILGKPISTFMLEEYMECFKEVKSRWLEGFSDMREIDFVHKDGSIVLSLFKTKPILGKKNKLMGVIVFIEDISRKKILKEALHFSKESIYNVISNSTDGMIVIDQKGKILYANPAVEKLFGAKESQLLGTNFEYPIIKGRATEINISQKDGKTGTGNMVITETIWENRKAYLAVIHDISKQKNILKETKKARDRAIEACKAKELFLNCISHELRTPLTGIIGVSDILKETSLSEEQMDLLNSLKKSEKVLLNVINNILEFSKLDSDSVLINYSSFNLKKIIKSSISLFKIYANDKSLALAYSLYVDMPEKVIGDKDHLINILNNLLGNAIKFTEEGEVELKVRLGQDKNINPDHKILDKQKFYPIQFSIIDTGIGISKENIGMIFDSFTQVDASYTRKFGGVGLGLSLVKKLLNLMGGTIDVKSQIGAGSTFSFTLPFLVDTYSDQVKIKEDKEELETAELISEQIKVLIVEDDIANRFVIKSYLTEINAITDEAENGEVALKKYIEGSYDLVLMDIRMPIMDGLTASKLIRKWEKDNQKEAVPIIALTAHVFDKDRIDCMDAGCNAFIIKPIERFDFLEIINDLTKK